MSDELYTMMKVILLTICGCLPLCQGYPGGPPPEACVSMTPKHGQALAQTSTAPYTITTSSDTYRRGQNITVTVAATNAALPFKGFFIQARRTGSTVSVGRFYLGTETQARLMKCPGRRANNAVSHDSRANKTSKTVIWNNQDGSDVYFQATFVQSQFIFWTNVRSRVVRANSTGVTTTSPSNADTTSASGIIRIVLVAAVLLMAIL